MMAIKDLDIDNRPRERATKFGFSGLSDAELLAIIIASRTKGSSALDIAYRILEKVHSLNNLASLDLNVLDIKGVGITKKITIGAALEIGRRALDSADLSKIYSPEAFYQRFRTRFIGLAKETFWLILLNNKKQIVFESMLESDDRDAVSFSYRSLMKLAIRVDAPYAVAIHNHPSGNCRPSPLDDKATLMMMKSLKLIKVILLDHLIMTERSYYSYFEEKRLETLHAVDKDLNLIRQST